MSIPRPLILDDVGIKISDDGTPTGLTDLGCSGNHIELSPDVAVTTLDTFCGSVDYPGVVKWSLIATLYQSFDAGGPEEILSAAVTLGEPAPFEIIPYKSQPVGPQNPSWSGTVIPQPYSPINGDAGDASTIDLEWALVGAPVKSITPGAGTMQASANLDSMTLAELQAEAESRGLATSGTKAELIERLS